MESVIIILLANSDHMHTGLQLAACPTGLNIFIEEGKKTATGKIWKNSLAD